MRGCQRPVSWWSAGARSGGAGIGRLGVDAALAGDLPVVAGFVLVIGISVTIINLLVDIGYSMVDPRQRSEMYL